MSLSSYHHFLDQEWIREVAERFEEPSQFGASVASLLSSWNSISKANGMPDAILSTIHPTTKEDCWETALQSEAVRDAIFASQRLFFVSYCDAYLRFLANVTLQLGEKTSSIESSFDAEFAKVFEPDIYESCWNDPEIQFQVEVSRCLSQFGGKPVGPLSKADHHIEIVDGLLQIREQDFTYMASCLIRAFARMLDVLGAHETKG